MGDAYKCGACGTMNFFVMTGPQTPEDPGIRVYCNECDQKWSGDTLAEAFAAIAKPPEKP